jgi:hypothetical protein
MKGSVVQAMKEMIVEKYGAQKWQEALVKAGINKEPLILPISDIDDQVVMNIIKSACDVLNLSLEQVADDFGDYWVNVYTQKIYRVHYLDCNTSKDFLLKMDSVHVMVTKNIPNAHPPRFEYEWKDEKTLIMKYKSHRNLIDFLVGMIKGVGKFYKEDLKVTKLSNDKVEIVFP